ncbi:MAG: S-methyl-5'-thioinosine phosphorylase [Gammaproteobacteria bacterium]|jgi:purine nucleoside phosphorylase|nr:S-methyl-5'-thioinosine phosphorylase [Gammaproteobacteria bacterium]MDP6694330.1 S-methyl-5'-thioinosine phosphorylase [Gammaproteobacteria bacterium]
MATIALIAGTGARLFPFGDVSEVEEPETRWGWPSTALLTWQQSGHRVLYLSRHGVTGNIPPHRVNYRANIAALAACEAEYIVALNGVGAIQHDLEPGSLVIPDQLIDYTWGRQHTIHDGSNLEVEYIDFTEPYDNKLRHDLIAAGHSASLPLADSGTYAVTQGPRLETAAEIDRLERDGCDIVGMTAMPEAVLAREYGVPYASCCIVLNAAAGRGGAPIHTQIRGHMETGMQAAAALFAELLQRL